jgi:dUTP pyrophosphatase
MNIEIKRLHADAVIPRYARAGDAGFDLVALEDVIVRPGETVRIPTGLAFEIPQGYELQIRPRSGVSSKTKLRVILGTVDSGFRGEVAVMVDNIAQNGNVATIGGQLVQIHTNHRYSVLLVDGTHQRRYSGVSEKIPCGTYLIRKGDRIAQGVIAPVVSASFVEVAELSESERGVDGFGSTGTSVEVGV